LGLAPVAGRVGSAVGRGAYATEQAIGAGAQAVGSGIRTAAMAPVQAAKGAFNAATGGESALVPLGKTYITPEGAQLLREGKIDVATAESPQYTRPISELPSNAIERGALQIAGKQMPVAGKGAQAFGERVMSDYIANPYKAAVDIGIPLVTGVPFSPYSIGRGLQAGADYLLARKGFDPGLNQTISAAKTQQAFQPPQVPQLTYNPSPSPGPVEPSTIYATQGGQAGTNLPQVGQAALGEKYPSAPVSPAETSQQAAAARIQPAAPAMSAEQQAVIDQVRARTAAKTEADRAARVAALQQRAQAAGGYTPPMSEAPVAPVAPTAVPETPPTTTNTLTSLRDRLTPQTPEQLAAVDTYNAKTPADKAKATREANKRAAAEQQAAEAQRQKIIEQHRIKIQSQDDAFSQPGSYDRPLAHDDAMSKITWDNAKNKPTTVYGTGTYNNAPAIWKRNPDGSGYIETFTGIRNEPAVTWEFNKVGNNLEVKQIYHARDQQITWENGKVVKYFDEGKNKLPEASAKTGVGNPKDWTPPSFEDKLKQIKSPEYAKRNAPPGVLEMKTGEETGAVPHADRAAFDKANTFNAVASKPSTGSYREGNKIITVTAVDTGNWPLPPGRVPPTTATAVDAVTGERVPVGKTWTADDPQPFGAKVRNKLNKK